MTIPISLRAKLGWLEGTRVKLVLRDDELILSRDDQSGVMASIGTCGVSGSGSSPGSGLGKNRGDKNVRTR